MAINHKDDAMDVHTGTISRRMRGVTLPPWRSVTYYAETGSRCPAAPEHDLRDYIGRCYRSRAAKEGLRAALAETLAELPQVDRRLLRRRRSDTAVGCVTMARIMLRLCRQLQ